MPLSDQDIDDLATNAIRCAVNGITRSDVKRYLEGGGPLGNLDDAEYEQALDQIASRIEDVADDVEF